MELKTKYFGMMTVDDTKVVHFTQGIPGFLEEQHFVLLDLPGNPVFQILQSIQTSEVAFVVTNPYHFYQEYTFDLDDQAVNQLQLMDKEDVIVYVTVTMQNELKDSTLNLRAPIIVNAAKNLAKQYIIEGGDHSVKAPITMDVMKSVKGEV